MINSGQVIEQMQAHLGQVEATIRKLYGSEVNEDNSVDWLLSCILAQQVQTNALLVQLLTQAADGRGLGVAFTERKAG